MRWINKPALIIASFLFVLPVLVYPVRGIISNNVSTYTYGFPFAWFSVYYTAQTDRVFFWQALAEPNQGIHIDFITAILNFIILYIVMQAIIRVFWSKKKQHQEKKQQKKQDHSNNHTEG